MKAINRRDLIKTSLAVASLSSVSVDSIASNKPYQSKEPVLTNQNLTESIDAIFGEHMEAELAGDLDKTMATMSENPHLVNVPTMVGGQGQAGVKQFYTNRLIGQFFPPDVKFETISRTYSPNRLIDELIISFTHTIQMDHILPGVKPTGKFVEAAFVVIVGIEDGKVTHEHIHWDQANVLVQIGLIDPTGLPVTGAGAAAKLRDPSIPDPFFNEA